MAYRETFSTGARGGADASPAPGAAREPAPETRERALAPERPAPSLPTVQAASARAEAPDPAKPRKGRKRFVLAAVALAALGFGGYEGYGWWTTGRFTLSTDDAYVQADITILAAKIPGYVASVAVENNQHVKAGDVIAKIDEGDYRLALQAAQDKLATQGSTIERIGRQVEAAKASIAQAAAQVEAAKADAVRAAADYQRQAQLAQQDYTSRARLEQARADRDRTEANVRSADAALQAARANVDVLSAQQAEASRVAAELRTAADKAARDLSFTEVRAPVDGVVGNKAVEVGTYVQPGTRLAALVPLASVHVDANFKETQLRGLRPGQEARIAVDAYPDHDIVGSVESVAPASGSVFSLLPAENATGNFTKIVQRVPVRIAVPRDVAEQSLLRPGLSVVVKVDTRDRGEPGATKTAQVLR